MSLHLGDGLAGLRVGDLPATRAYLGDALAYELAPVTLVVEGTAFEPVLELAEGSTATVTWMDESDNVLATGTTPTITLPDATPRQVFLHVSVLADVTTLNLGFHEGQDNGRDSLPASYRHVTQPVTGISNLQNLSGLRRFMCARTDGVSNSHTSYSGPLMTGHLNFSGMASLEFIETYRSDVSSVSLTGCTSLIRLCLEGVALSGPLDLNPVRGNLRDLRAAVQRGGVLEVAPLDGPMTELWHFCTRDQQLIGLPDMADLPAIEQLWIWNDSLSMDVIAPRNAEGLQSILIYSNQFAHLDLENAVWQGAGQLRASDCDLESVNLDGMEPIGYIRLGNNNFSQSMVDYILTTVEAWGTSNGTLEIDHNAIPSSTGLSLAATLTGRGWTVTYDAPVAAAITTTALSALVVDEPFNQQLAADGDLPITWSHTSGTLPDGITLDGSGVLSGTPTTEGAYDFTVTATNAYGSDAQQYTGEVSGVPVRTLLWSDEFDRANSIGWANSGGWHPGYNETDSDVEINNGTLILRGPSTYRRFLHSGSGFLPADLEVEIGFTDATPGLRGTYWGVCARVNAAGQGVKAMFGNTLTGTNFRTGNASSYADGSVTDISGNMPAAWGTAGQHTFGIRCIGDSITVFCDGQQVHQTSLGTNMTLEGGDIGFLGEAQNRAWDYIRVYSIGAEPEVDDPTVTSFSGDTLPEGWNEVVPSGASVTMEGEYLRLATPPGANMDCLSAGTTAPQGPYVWTAVDGPFDFAVALAEEPNNMPQQGFDIVALDESGSGGARFCVYAPALTQSTSFRTDHNYYVYQGGSKSVTGNTTQLYGAAGWLRVAWDGASYTFYQSRTGLSGSWVQISTFSSSFIPTRFGLHANATATSDTTNGREQRIARVVDLMARGSDDATEPVPEFTRQTVNTFDGSLPTWAATAERNGGAVTVDTGVLALAIDNEVAGSHASITTDELPENHGILLRYRVVNGYQNAFWVAGVALEDTTTIAGAVVLDDKYGFGNLMLMEMPARVGDGVAERTVRMLRRSPVPSNLSQSGNREFDGYSMLIEDLAFPISTIGSQWTMMRFEKAGRRFRTRVWLDGDTEPTTWNQELEDHARRGLRATLTLGSNDAAAGGTDTARVEFSGIETYALVSP